MTLATRAAVVMTLLLGAGLMGPVAASAQEVKVELKGGAAVGNYTETEAGLEWVPGPTFGAIVELWPTESLAAYVAVNRSSFGCEEGFCTGRDVTPTSQGLAAGARWSPGLPWVRAGVAMQWLDIQATGESETTDAGIGVELAGGLDFPLWDRFRMRPGVVYLRHDASTAQAAGHVALLALEIGVAVELASF